MLRVLGEILHFAAVGVPGVGIVVALALHNQALALLCAVLVVVLVLAVLREDDRALRTREGRQ